MHRLGGWAVANENTGLRRSETSLSDVPLQPWEDKQHPLHASNAMRPSCHHEREESPSRFTCLESQEYVVRRRRRSALPSRSGAIISASSNYLCKSDFNLCTGLLLARLSSVHDQMGWPTCELIGPTDAATSCHYRDQGGSSRRRSATHSPRPGERYADKRTLSCGPTLHIRRVLKVLDVLAQSLSWWIGSSCVDHERRASFFIRLRPSTLWVSASPWRLEYLRSILWLLCSEQAP